MLQLCSVWGVLHFIELASSAGWESSEATIPLFSARARAAEAEWCMPVERQSTPAAGDGDGSDVGAVRSVAIHTSGRFGVLPTGVAVRRCRKTRLYHPVSKFDTTSARITAAQEDLHGIKSMDHRPFPVTFDAARCSASDRQKGTHEPSSTIKARRPQGSPRAGVLTLPLQSAMGLVWKLNMY
jgi:hypothetical protein